MTTKLILEICAPLFGVADPMWSLRPNLARAVADLNQSILCVSDRLNQAIGEWIADEIGRNEALAVLTPDPVGRGTESQELPWGVKADHRRSWCVKQACAYSCDELISHSVRDSESRSNVRIVRSPCIAIVAVGVFKCSMHRES